MANKVVAICLGDKSAVDKDKLRVEMGKAWPAAKVEFYAPPEGMQQNITQLLLHLVRQAPEADVLAAIQGSTFAVGSAKEERPAEEIQISVKGRSGILLDFALWRGNITVEQQLSYFFLAALGNGGTQH